MKLLICLFAVAATAMSQSNVEILKTGNERFTANMFQEVVKANAGKNVVLSAFSVLSPLAQLALASVGESHDEILRAIGLPNDNVTKEVFSDVSKQLRSVKGVELRMANRVYVRKGGALNEQFAAVSRDVFNSDVKNIDFSQNVAAADEINSWVEDNTNHRIKNLVSPDSLGLSTSSVLVNAIYFKGTWLHQFEKYLTKDKEFHVSKDQTITVPTMTQTHNFNYGESKELDAKLLEMPYKGRESSLLIVLPNEIDGLNALVEKIKDPLALNNAIKDMYNTEVVVELPKFKIETTTNLKTVLENMNVKKLFIHDEAHLDNLLKGNSHMFVSSAIQKAYIDVNEEGAEAAAANEFVISGSSYKEPGPPPMFFIIDRPFYFALKMVNTPLFSGLLTVP